MFDSSSAPFSMASVLLLRSYFALIMLNILFASSLMLIVVNTMGFSSVQVVFNCFGHLYTAGFGL